MKFIADVFVFLTIVIHLATAGSSAEALARRLQEDAIIDDCTGVTCENGGTCVYGECQCPSEYSGTYCQTATVATNYIRWGRTTCGSNSSVIYKGQAAGALYNGAGGGANYQCMPDTPQWLSSSTPGPMYSYIYGVEYSSSNDIGNSIANNPTPCVACLAVGRSTQLMIPARTECPTGWTQEYRGYLVAEHAGEGRHRSSYVCLDEAPEVASGALDRNQAVVYRVRVGCGSLPCSTYTDSSVIACVVCTR